MTNDQPLEKPIGIFKNLIFDFETPEGVEGVKKLREANPNKKIVFASGCYDVFQSGHAIFFEQCKQQGDIVVISVGRDSVVRELKREPIQPEWNRAYVVAAQKCVDYVIIDQATMSEGKIVFGKVLEVLKPDVFVLNDDDSGVVFKRALCERLRIKLELVRRITPDFLEPTSTTAIIRKIRNGDY